MIGSGYVHSIKMFDFFQVNQVTHDQAVVLQSALQSIPNPSSECMLRNVSIRLAQQISDEVSIKLVRLSNSRRFISFIFDPLLM